MPYHSAFNPRKIGQFNGNLKAVYYLEYLHSVIGFVYNEQNNETSIQSLSLFEIKNSAGCSEAKELLRGIDGVVECQGTNRIQFFDNHLHVLTRLQEGQYCLYSISFAGEVIEVQRRATGARMFHKIKDGPILSATQDCLKVRSHFHH